MSWDLLKRFLESDVFNQNPFLSVSYLSRYADHVGIHYVLCNKLRQFPYEEIEFYLPQLCHLVISINNESMALEEFLLDLCEESVTAALLTFWLFQTYLHDVSATPSSNAFRTCRRVYNKVQHVVFGFADTARHVKIRENILPVAVLGSFVLASVACPILPAWAGPLAVAQARKPRPIGGDTLPATSETAVPPTPSRAQTVVVPGTRARRTKDSGRSSAPPSRVANDTIKSPRPKSPSRPSSSGSSSRTPTEPRRHMHLETISLDARASSASLPLPAPKSPRTRPTTPVSDGFGSSEPSHQRRHSHSLQSMIGPPDMTSRQKVLLLKQNHFRCQTAFLTALQDISNRLVVVPKAARLSALRAELALIAQDLPAEVDIPVICPPTLVKGIPSTSRHHRVVRLNPAEATVLNSAEKVPYLLMVEILKDDFNFDAASQDNQMLMTNLLAEQGSGKRMFDLSDAPRVAMPTIIREPEPECEPIIDSVFEPTLGDLGNSPYLHAEDHEPGGKKGASGHALRLPSAGTTTFSLSELSLTSPRSSGPCTCRSESPPVRKSVLPPPPTPSIRGPTVDQTDFSALATHMRTASQMLAQLEQTTGKRPRGEVEAIRTKIIASMQTLEEQSFDVDDGQGTTLDLIMAKTPATPALNGSSGVDMEDAETIEPALDAKAGIARMENDFKTGGLQRKGDRDDPSAAVFGEGWDMKKERIRKSSPYGWMKNWDLVSVIVKTGADLRQEAFACQLIRFCHKVWIDAHVPVWVYLMRILVTGESTGLIETITNAVSLHSIKRSLTLSSIESGRNPRRRIATLKDHFVKAFGLPESEPYRTAVDAFKRSLAAYSIISYVFQLKDRHNGNVLIDNEGHIVHIDFGFMLSNSPGSVGFEAAPFKLTYEYMEILGGVNSPDYEHFKKLCKQAFQALRRSADNIIDLVAMMGQSSSMPCYGAGIATVTSSLRQRFQLHLSAEEAERFVDTDLVAKSLGSYYTRLYDTYQYRTQGIY